MTERINIADAPEAAWLIATSAIKCLDGYDWACTVNSRYRADSIGHIIDPTAYRDLIGNKTVAKNLKLAEAIVEFLRRARESHPELFEDEGGE